MRRVYLDHNASTPVHPDVLAAMLPYFSERFGNASSIHGFGREARDGIDVARESIAGFLEVTPEEIVFTSGGTESDNLAVKGVAGARPGGHVVTTQVEHHAVLRTCQALEQAGHAVTYLPVDGEGLVDPDDVRRALRPDTVLISIQTANSESGTLMPVEEIGRIATERGIPFHVDGVQTFGKLPASLRESGIALMSMSSHKIYGPKGIGALYIRKGTRMVSVQHGGDHERRRRAGTENVPAIVGFGKAVELRALHMAEEAGRVSALRDRLWEGVRRAVPDVRLNGHPDAPSARDAEHELPRPRGGVPDPGARPQGHRGLGGLGVHVGEPRALLRDHGHGGAGGVGARRRPDLARGRARPSRTSTTSSTSCRRPSSGSGPCRPSGAA